MDINKDIPIKITCLQVVRHRINNRLEGYIVLNENGETKFIEHKEMKELLRNRIVDCDNLELTNSNRIIAKKVYKHTNNKPSAGVDKFRPNIFGVEVRNIQTIEYKNKVASDVLYYTGEIWFNDKKLGDWQQGETFEQSSYDFNTKILKIPFDKYKQQIINHSIDSSLCDETNISNITLDEFIIKVIILTEYFNIYKQVRNKGYKGIIVITDKYDYLVKIIEVEDKVTDKISKLISIGQMEIRTKGYRENKQKSCKPIIKYYLSLKDFEEYI